MKNKEEFTVIAALLVLAIVISLAAPCILIWGLQFIGVNIALNIKTFCGVYMIAIAVRMLTHEIKTSSK